MTRTKLLVSTLLVAIFLTTQVITAGAAPTIQDSTPIIGTVQNIVLETDTTTGETTILVTVLDDTGAIQTLRLSTDIAIELGLVTDDGTGNFAVNDAAVGTAVEIDPTTVISDAVEGDQHPVGSTLSDFFSGLFGVNYDTIMEFHDSGIGFGVIAQALWMTNAVGGDSETFAAILDAKQNKDFGAITLPDGSTPTNWGQFRKAVMDNRDKAKENLGAIMSGHANDQMNETQIDPSISTTNFPASTNGNHGNGNGRGNGNQNGNNKNKNK